MTHHEQTLRQYLFSKLGEGESDALEGDLLEDSALFERVEALDGELILDLEDGALMEAEAVALRRRIDASSTAKADWEFHRLLSRRFRSGAPAPADLRRRDWRHFGRGASALVAALLTFAVSAVIFGSLLSRHVKDPVLTLASESADFIQESVAPVRATFMVAPLTRSSGTTASLAVTPGSEIVELWLRTPYSQGPFRVTVSAAGEEIMSFDDALVVERSWGSFVAVELEASDLPADSLDLLLERRSEDWAAVASYSVSIGDR